MQFELPYTLVRYSPDDLRGEIFNVGVAVIAPPHLTVSLDLSSPQRLSPFLPAGQSLDLDGIASGIRDQLGQAIAAAIDSQATVDLEQLFANASRALGGRVQFSLPGRIDFDVEEELLVPAAERIAQIILARCVRTEHLGETELQVHMPSTGDALDALEYKVHAPMPDWMRRAHALDTAAPGFAQTPDLVHAPSPSQRRH